jgi:small GTP-binding protein
LGIKVTLIGDSSVGKTSIINRYCKNIFDQSIGSTLGANYSQKIIEKDGKKIRLDLWDTAGQEKYRAIGRHFYRESFIVCLVYDITNKKSFENIKSIWYPELMDHGEKLKIIGLIGNKNDRYLDESVDEKNVKEFADEIHALYKKTSALDNTGIDDLFDELISKYLKEIGDLMSPNADNDRKEDKIIIEKDNKKDRKKRNCC